jgi:hypothetical protein
MFKKGLFMFFMMKKVFFSDPFGFIVLIFIIQFPNTVMSLCPRNVHTCVTLFSANAAFAFVCVNKRETPDQTFDWTYERYHCFP